MQVIKCGSDGESFAFEDHIGTKVVFEKKIRNVIYSTKGSLHKRLFAGQL